MVFVRVLTLPYHSAGPTSSTEKDIGAKNPRAATVLGFFRAFFQGGIQKISFPKNGLWGGLELPTQAFGGRFCGLFRKICPFFRFRIC